MNLKRPDKLKLVLDTSTYVAALLSPEGGSAKIFEEIMEDKHFNFYTEEIIKEVEEVLKREKFSFPTHEITQFINLITSSSFEIKQLEEFKIEKCRDPKDDMFLSLSKQIEADYLISLDKDLLDLKNIEKTRIIKPEELLQN